MVNLNFLNCKGMDRLNESLLISLLNIIWYNKLVYFPNAYKSGGIIKLINIPRKYYVTKFLHSGFL